MVDSDNDVGIKDGHLASVVKKSGPDPGRELDPAMFQRGRRLGAGACASVYLATCEGSQKKYVIKRLDRVSDTMSEEIKNEVRKLTKDY